MLLFPRTADTNTTYKHQNRDMHSEQDLTDEQAMAVIKFVLLPHMLKVRI